MIGVFDSGLGGLTILQSIRQQLPQYDYLYLGDNARAPYGTRSFDVVYDYTWQAVRYLFEQGCRLVILACNTASAKALRSIQQHDLLLYDPQLKHRVLGIIRPTAEVVGSMSSSKHIGILATQGTVNSNSYPIEIGKRSANVTVVQQPCPMWVPLIENNEHLSEGADYFVRLYIDQLLSRDPLVDTILLGCTHYPMLKQKILQYLPGGVRLVEQGDIVARSLADYLNRHAEIERNCTKGQSCCFLTTENAERFATLAEAFIGQTITAHHISL